MVEFQAHRDFFRFSFLNCLMGMTMFVDPTIIYLFLRSQNVNPKPQVSVVGYKENVQTQFPCVSVLVPLWTNICTKIFDLKIIFYII